MDNSKAEHQLRITRIIWVIFLVSQFSFFTALFLAKPELFNFDPGVLVLGETPLVPIIFVFLAFTNLAFSFLVKSLAVKKAIEEGNLKLLQSGTILALAFCEAVSIMGLVLAFAFSYQYFFVWFALGILGILLHFPKRENFLAAAFKKF